jgi:hypothetical protein
LSWKGPDQVGGVGCCTGQVEEGGTAGQAGQL